MDACKWADPKSAMPSPSFYALRNAYAPVAVAIDLFDKHFRAEQRLTSSVCVMNSTSKNVSGTLQVAVLSCGPGFDWDGIVGKDSLWQESSTVHVEAFVQKRVEIEWPLPAKEGHWALVAIWRCDGQMPVYSKRTVFTISPPPSKPLSDRTVAVFDADGALTTWLKQQGAELTELRASNVAVVGSDIHRLATFADEVPGLLKFVEAGGDLIILEQSRWIYDALANVDTVRIGYRGGISTVFRKDQPNHRIWRDVPESYMRRWNGLPGAIARYALQIDREHVVLAIGTEKSKYPKTALCIEMKQGKGHILFCQFMMHDRVELDAPHFDPVAERILLNLLGAEQK